MEENISEALVMAASVLIFVIALSVIFSLISQAKSTSDAILYSYDDTKYYYDEDLENITFTTARDENINRTVTMETIMPTVYRYIKEHYGVTIFDKNGEIIARFDETTESIVNNWTTYLKEARKNTKEESACEKHYKYLKDLAIAAKLQEKFQGHYRDYNDLAKLWEEIYALDKTRGSNGSSGSGNTQIKYGTPWLGDEGKIASRLNADFSGETAEYATGVHKGLNLLGNKKYSDKKFKEIYLFVSDNSGIEKDELSGDSVVVTSTTKKLEIIYVMQ